MDENRIIEAFQCLGMVKGKIEEFDVFKKEISTEVNNLKLSQTVTIETVKHFNESIIDLKKSMNESIIDLKNIVNTALKEIKDIKDKPGQRWNMLTAVIITAVATQAINIISNLLMKG